MSAAPGIQVQVTRQFSAPAERVFDAWLDPRLLNGWMFGKNVRDEEVLRIETTPRVGGTFSFLVRRQGQEIHHVGTYLEIDRPRRLVFTWGIEGASDADEVPSRVSIDLRSTASGCELTLTHTMDPKWAEYADRTQAGWTTMLGALDRALTSTSGGTT